MPAADEIEPADALDRYGRLYRSAGAGPNTVHIAAVVDRGDCSWAIPPAEMLEIRRDAELPLRAEVCEHCVEHAEEVADR